MLGAAAPDSQHCRRPVGSLAHTPSSSHRADSPANSPRVYFATLALLYHWPCHMITEHGTPAYVRLTRRPWLETGPVFSHACKSSLPIGRDALVGPILEEVGKLSNLGGLGLIGHHITGPIPESLNDLEKFHGLGIRHTLVVQLF